MWDTFDDDKLAEHLIHLEGDSSVAKKNHNPGNLKNSDGTFQKFDTDEEGKQALMRQLKSWRRRFPDWSIDDLNKRYAPNKSAGGDNPDGTVEARNAYLMQQAQ